MKKSIIKSNLIAFIICLTTECKQHKEKHEGAKW